MTTPKDDNEILIAGMLSRSTARELAEALVTRCACTFNGTKLVSECEFHRQRQREPWPDDAPISYDGEVRWPRK